MGKLFYGTLNAHMKAWRREQNLIQVNDEIQQQKNLILRNQSNAKFNIAKSINDITLLKSKLIDINRTQGPISQKVTDASIDTETGLVVSDQERVKEWINQMAAKASIVPVPSVPSVPTVPSVDQSKLTEQVAQLVKLMTDILNKKSEPVIQQIPIAAEPKAIAVDVEPEEKAPAQITEVGEDDDKAQPKPQSRVGQAIDTEGMSAHTAHTLPSPSPFMNVHIDRLSNKYIYDELNKIEPRVNLDVLQINGFKNLFGKGKKTGKWPAYPTNTSRDDASSRQYINRFLFRDFLENENLLKFKEGSNDLLVDMTNDEMIEGIKALIEYNYLPPTTDSMRSGDIHDMSVRRAVIHEYASLDNGGGFNPRDIEPTRRIFSHNPFTYVPTPDDLEGALVQPARKKNNKKAAIAEPTS